MRSPDALAAALTMLQSPQLVRLARQAPLPRGVTFLLEVAASEPDALSDASRMTGQPAPMLQKAAAFFVEQIMLSRHSDSYRMLGAQSGASQHDLRRHLALLMRWLHPDMVGDNGAAQHFDRRVYASRVAEAWDAIKTQDKRAAYEAARQARTSAHSIQSAKKELWHRTALIRRGRRRKHLTVYRLRGETLWHRLLALLGGSR